MFGARKLSDRSASWLTAAQSHVGCVRANNEDRYLVQPDVGLFAVADGMGGHDAGDVASAAVIDGLTALGSMRLTTAEVEDRLQTVNHDLHQRGQTSHKLIGSTVVALLAPGDEYVCMWAGDSRCYLHRAGMLTQLTNDHSLVQQLVDNRRLSEREARSHPQLNVITRAIGAMPDLTLERRRGPIKRGDVFLLCSDGLWGTLETGDINAILDAQSPPSAAEALVELALRRGARDNVTVVLAHRI